MKGFDASVSHAINLDFLAISALLAISLPPFPLFLRVSKVLFFLPTAILQAYNSFRNVPLLPRLHLTVIPPNLRSDVLYPHL